MRQEELKDLKEGGKLFKQANVIDDHLSDQNLDTPLSLAQKQIPRQENEMITTYGYYVLVAGFILVCLSAIYQTIAGW